MPEMGARIRTLPGPSQPLRKLRRGTQHQGMHGQGPFVLQLRRQTPSVEKRPMQKIRKILQSSNRLQGSLRRPNDKNPRNTYSGARVHQGIPFGVPQTNKKRNTPGRERSRTPPRGNKQTNVHPLRSKHGAKCPRHPFSLHPQPHRRGGLHLAPPRYTTPNTTNRNQGKPKIEGRRKTNTTN